MLILVPLYGAQPLLKLRCSARGFSSWPPGWPRRSGMFVSGFVTEKNYFDNVIQLNNVRSHVESFARAFILHRAYAARANDQKQLRASAPIADARRTRGPSRVQGCSADADYSRHAAEGPACVLSSTKRHAARNRRNAAKDDPVQKFFVDTKKHAPYQYPKPKHSPYQKAHPEKSGTRTTGRGSTRSETRTTQ